MSNTVQTIAVPAVSMPEVATRQQWTETARTLAGVAGEAGIFGNTSKEAAHAAIVAQSYSLLIYGAIANDSSRLDRIEKYARSLPNSLDKNGAFKGAFAKTIAVLRVASTVGKSMFKDIQGLAEIGASTLFDSITLHEELKALAPKAPAPKVTSTSSSGSSSGSSSSSGSESKKQTGPKEYTVDEQRQYSRDLSRPIREMEIAHDAQWAAYADSMVDDLNAEKARKEWLAKQVATRLADMETDTVVLKEQFRTMAEKLGITLTKAQLAKLAA